MQNWRQNLKLFCIQINNAVNKQDRKKIELLIVKSKNALTSVIEKNEKLIDLALTTEDPLITKMYDKNDRVIWFGPKQRDSKAKHIS